MAEKSDYADQKKQLDFSVWGNVLLTIIELAAGFLANSAAVVSLAFHDFSDVVTSLVARAAVSQAEKQPTSKMTFGYHRITILVALLNSMILVVLTLFVMYEGFKRILNPVHIDPGVVSAVAIGSMAVNGFIAYRLWKNNRDLNIRALFWHIADDFLGGIAVLLVAIITLVYDWHYADGIATLIVGLIVLKGVWGVVNDIVEVIMEATPNHIKLDEVVKATKKIRGVKSVHDLHVWTLGSNVYCLSAHVQVKDAKLGSLLPTTNKIKSMLSEKFGITHSTLEMECADCETNEF